MLIFLDSFDHYTDLSIKWSQASSALIVMGQSRTGIQSCSCFPFGPSINFTPQVSMVIGTAYKPTAFGNDIFGLISGVNRQARLRMNNDGSVSVTSANDPFPVVYGTSAPNLIQANIYAYVEMKVSAFAVGATVTVHINGASILTCIANTDPDLTGVATTFYLQGPGGGNFAYHDDVYVANLIDSGVPGQPNNDFFGPIRNFAQVPIADGSPLQWTPLIPPTNFTNVDEIPPDDDTSYVSSSNVGDEDQYVYGTTGISPPVQVFGVQVCLDARIDIAGARSIAPDVGGLEGNSVALSTSYDIVKQTYDGNPVSGIAWQLTDFATVQFGPKVTA